MLSRVHSRRAGLALGVISFLAASCAGPEDVENRDLPTTAEIIAATEEAAGEIVVAATPAVYVDHLDPRVDLAETFQQRSGGVWCGGAVAWFASELKNRGYTVATLNFGVEGYWTHMVVLVQSDEGFILADPYLGQVWTDSFKTASTKIARGELPEIYDFGVSRVALFEEMPRTGDSWLLGRNSENPPTCSRSGDALACLVQHDATDYSQIYPTSREFIAFLEGLGYPPSISSGVMRPLSLRFRGDHHAVSSAEEVISALVS